MDLLNIPNINKNDDLPEDEIQSRSNTSFIRLPQSSFIWPRMRDQQQEKSWHHNNSNNGNHDTSAGEIITARRFKSLQNAAFRPRSAHYDQTNGYYNQDDSIIGDTTNVDLTDGVDLRAERLDMSFSLLDAASLIFSMCSFFLDLVIDITVAVFHYLNGDYWYSALTVAFIVIPTLVTTSFSMRWYILDSQVPGSEPISKRLWIVRILFHIFQVGPILRYYESLQYGIKFRETKDPEEKKRVYMKMLYEDADATMLRLFESFMESAPQLMLQMYILTKNYPFDDYEYYTIVVQVMSISSSLISISWSLVSYSKCLRFSLPDKIPMTYWSIAVMFLWEFFSIAARMIALALFTSAFVRYIGLVCLIHWAGMTLWILTMQTSFCNTRYEELGFNVVLGIIFIFCYFNPVDNATRYRYMAFYTFMFVENSILMFFWATHSKFDLWIKELALYAQYSSFFLGIFLMVVSSNWKYPDLQIKLRHLVK